MDLGEPDPDEVLELLAGAVGIASPAGSEAELAEWIAGWLQSRHPELVCNLDRFSGARANLECTARGDPAEGLLLYGHLDTSLSGDPDLDRPVGAPAYERLALERRGDVLSGHGVVVAKGPMAAAVVGFALAVRTLAARGHATRAKLLLASGGTHRARPPGLELSERAPSTGAGEGVRRYLSLQRALPQAAVVAKAGPVGLLYEEPGAAFAVLELRGEPGLVMARDAHVEEGGMPAVAGSAVRAVERWRKRFVSRASESSCQAGREAGVGALSCGLPYKPDLVAGVLDLHVYLVLGPGDDPEEAVSELAQEVTDSGREDGWKGIEVKGVLLDSVPSARTAPDAAVVRFADDAYREIWGGAAPRPAGWTGSSDGVLLRRAGMDTVRVGPAPLDARLGREAISLQALVSFARLYARIVERFSLA